ncbi:MAG: OmpA family protein, partial [Bdellovibrionales bacterium]|nr:OmpA family protein [Bdellovibrionales bacterium]
MNKNERSLGAQLAVNFAGHLCPFHGAGASGPAHANVVGADTQNFNPITDGLDFVTVHSSETLQPGVINFGLFLNYAVNSLPNYENVSTQSRTNFKDTLLSGDFNLGLGLAPRWDLGMSFPAVLAQHIDSDVNTFRGEFAQTGMTEIRANTKYRFSGAQDHGTAIVASMNFNQIQNNPFAGSEAGPTFNLELVADKTFGRYAVGGNVGRRFRRPGDQVAGVPVEPLKDQWIASAAVSYLLPGHDIKLIGELFGGIPAQSSQFASDRDLSSLEALAGMKMDLTPALAWHAGAATQVLHGTASPDWRVYTGLNWVVGPVFSRPHELIVRVDKAALDSLNADENPYGGKPSQQESFVARDVLFEFNKDAVNQEFLQSLARLVDYLKRPPGFKMLVVEGHTDSIGSDEYNQNLSER